MHQDTARFEALLTKVVDFAVSSPMAFAAIQTITEPNPKGIDFHLATSTSSPELVDALFSLRDEIDKAKGEDRRRKIKLLRGTLHRMQRRELKQFSEQAENAKRAESMREAMIDLRSWLKGPMVLQRLEGSHFPHLRHEIESERTFALINLEKPVTVSQMAMMWNYGPSVFVVEHDWARAFESANDVFTGPAFLPDEHCIFEFRYSGRIVLVLTVEVDGIYYLMTWVKAGNGTWILLGGVICKNGKFWTTEHREVVTVEDPRALFHSPDLREANADDTDAIPLFVHLDHQIRAIGVALDAKVATRNMVRMAYKSNMSKPAKGAKPFFSYHTVSLARRNVERAVPAERDPNAEPGGKRRLHFRRGHWRHFETFKTWVNWHLVGDPDLGFIDKHYKL